MEEVHIMSAEDTYHYKVYVDRIFTDIFINNTLVQQLRNPEKHKVHGISVAAEILNIIETGLDTCEHLTGPLSTEDKIKIFKAIDELGKEI